MIRLPPARSTVDPKLAHDGCDAAASPAAGGRRDDPNSGQPAWAPPSLLVAESVRFERRVNAHLGNNRGLPGVQAILDEGVNTPTRSEPRVLLEELTQTEIAERSPP